MIKTLRKLFGGIKMTWLRVILFAIATAALTACFVIFNIKPLTEMGVGFECWFVFAIFVISNCDNTLDAGLKTFVFFLISQPLIYLFQQPFSSVNLLRTYYLRWFIMTLLTFPGGMIAYQIKQNRFYSPLVLAVAGGFLSIEGVTESITYYLNNNYSYVVYYLFFILFAIVLGYIFLDKGKYRPIYLGIVFSVILGSFVFSIYRMTREETTTIDIPYQGTWQISSYTSNDVKIEMEDEDTICFTYKYNSSGKVECVNENGEIFKAFIEVENGNISIGEGE